MAGPSRRPGNRRAGLPGQPSRPRTATGQQRRTLVEAPAQSSGDGSARPRTSLTGRAAVLALVLVALAISYAYPLRAWYDQHQARSELQAESDRLEEDVAELEEELRLWDDPAYVRSEARDRLGYKMPGETAYMVVEEAEEPAAPEIGPDGLPVEPEGPWYSRLWTSVRSADAGPAESEQ